MRPQLLALLVTACLGCDPRRLAVVADGPHSAADAGPSDAAQDAEITYDASDAAQPSAETCDGRDEDSSGSIDDLDQGSDGLCDCLRIAAFGAPSAPASRHVLERWVTPRLALPPHRLGTRPLDGASLADVDVLLVEDLAALGRVFANDEAMALDAWLRAGGGIVVLAGFGTSTDNVNLLLAPYGLGFNPPTPLLPSGTELRVDTWTAHALSEGVSAAAIADGQPTRGLGTELARVNDNEIARVLEVDQGRVLLWGDDFISDAQAWESRSDLDIGRLWQNALAWLMRKGRCGSTR